MKSVKVHTLHQHCKWDQIIGSWAEHEIHTKTWSENLKVSDRFKNVA
jgi:hypothetical protein